MTTTGEGGTGFAAAKIKHSFGFGIKSTCCVRTASDDHPNQP